MRRFRRRLALGWRRWRRRQEGVAAVEFALVVTAFLWLFMGIVELGLLMIFNSGLEDGVERAGRMIRTGQASRQKISAAQFRDRICDMVVLRTSCSAALKVDVRSFRDFASIRGLQPPQWDSSGNLTVPASYSIGAPRQVVVVRAFYEWRFMTPLIGQLLSNTGRGTFLLNVATTFRNEPYGS